MLHVEAYLTFWSTYHADIARRCLVQLSYVIDVAKPLSLLVECNGSQVKKFGAVDIKNTLRSEFDCRPAAIAVSLALRSVVLCHWCCQASVTLVECNGSQVKQLGAVDKNTLKSEFDCRPGEIAVS